MSDNNIDWYEYIRAYKPEYTDDECEFVLWEMTCFPFYGEAEIKKQIDELFKPRTHD